MAVTTRRRKIVCVCMYPFISIDTERQILSKMTEMELGLLERGRGHLGE
jgi:hypothetical protein